MPVRRARSVDAPMMARVRVDTWRAAYREIVSQATLDNLSYMETERFLRHILWENPRGAFAFVAEGPVGEVVGVAVAGAALDREDPLYRGQIYILYVLPEWQGHGFGRELACACAEELVRRELAPFMLWTFANGPARGFYERLGGTLLRSREEDEDGRILVEVAFGWPDPEGLCGRVV
jgi:ribosomal protein S18 acetylase RimI-like enzyme